MQYLQDLSSVAELLKRDICKILHNSAGEPKRECLNPRWGFVTRSSSTLSRSCCCCRHVRVSQRQHQSRVLVGRVRALHWAATITSVPPLRWEGWGCCLRVKPQPSTRVLITYLFAKWFNPPLVKQLSCFWARTWRLNKSNWKGLTLSNGLGSALTVTNNSPMNMSLGTPKRQKLL